MKRLLLSLMLVVAPISMIYAHIRQTALITDDYALECADTNGDGKTTITDMLAVKAHILKKNTLSGAYAQAADTSADNNISITDFIQIKASILGKGTITAN